MEDCSVVYRVMTSMFDYAVRCLLLGLVFEWEIDPTVGQLALEYSEDRTRSEL